MLRHEFFELKAHLFWKMRVAGALKKDARKKKYFRLSSKKSAARATCNREGHELETDAAARVLRAQSSSFLEKMRGGSPK